MKLITIIKARAAINNHLHDKISYQTAYKFARFIKLTETQAAFYEEKTKELLETYVRKDIKGNYITKGNQIAIKEGHSAEDWSKASKELTDAEVDCPDVIFKSEDFTEIKVSAEEIISLSEFIKEG